MKRFKMPKIEKTDGDYKLWGLTIPKLPNGHRPQIIKRDRPRNNVVVKEDAIKPEAVIDGRSHRVEVDRGKDHMEERLQVEVAKETPNPIANGLDKTEPEQFADLVFSFFSSTDQHYLVHGGNYVDIDQPQRERCELTEVVGNDYEVMNALPPVPVESNATKRNMHTKTNKLHKSELTFYVSAASLKGSNGSIANVASSTYDLPSNGALRRSRSSSIFITQHRSLNDVHDSGSVKYQNSASLDNLSQVCNLSLKNADSKRSISSLPEMDTMNRKRRSIASNSIAFPKSIKSDHSSYFDHEKAIRLKNRISAIYQSHKGFKGKKRFSKAWYGIKEWFESEKSKIDNVIHKRTVRKVAAKSSDDYPESDFSEYEDVDEANVSMDSFTKDEDFCDDSVVSGCSNASGKRDTSSFDRRETRSRSACNSVFKLNVLKDGKVLHISEPNGSLRQSRSQPSVLLISEPVLVKINCESVDADAEHSTRQGDDSRMATTEGSVSPGCESPRSESVDITPQSPIHDHQINDQTGFAQLKAIVKEGSAACKELYSILQQRAEAERQYASGILRVGARARRASRGNAASSLISRRTAIDMENRAQLHRQFSNRLIDEVVRPLQRLVATRDAIRKQVERDVGLTARRLSDLRTSEGRSKKLSHGAARFNERIQDTSIGNGSTSAQEAELKKKKTKSEEAAAKSDVEYYMACLRAERARVEWETTMNKGSETLLEIEEERLSAMKRALRKYATLANLLGSSQISEEAVKLEEAFETTVDNEIKATRALMVHPPPSMHLPDFYSQHTTLAMNKERRIQALVRILQMIKTDMERERKSKQALEKLSEAITTTPNFGGNDSQQNVMEKLYHMRSVLTYLEGARVQAAANLAILVGRNQTPHPLSPHLKVARDRRGLQHTVLTVPPWLQFEYKGGIRALGNGRATSSPPSSPATPALTSRSSDRGAADGVSIQHYSDIDESISEEAPERPPPPKFMQDDSIADHTIQI